MDFHSVMETFAEAWVAANTHTPLTVAAEQGLINGPNNHTPSSRAVSVHAPPPPPPLPCHILPKHPVPIHTVPLLPPPPPIPSSEPMNHDTVVDSSNILILPNSPVHHVQTVQCLPHENSDEHRDSEFSSEGDVCKLAEHGSEDSPSNCSALAEIKSYVTLSKPHGKSLPVHCIVEQIPGPQACGQHVELDSYAIIPSDTLFNDLVRTALGKLGYSTAQILGAKGSIQIKKWKPLAFDQITENSEATVADILGELTTVATLHVRLYSVPDDPKEWKDVTVRNAVLELLREMSQSKLAKLCPLSQPMLSNIINNRYLGKIGKEKCQEFGLWYLTYRKQNPEGAALEVVPSDRPADGRLTFHPTKELPVMREWFHSCRNPSRRTLQLYVDILNQGPVRQQERPKVVLATLKNWWKNEKQRERKHQRDDDKTDDPEMKTRKKRKRSSDTSQNADNMKDGLNDEGLPSSNPDQEELKSNNFTLINLSENESDSEKVDKKDCDENDGINLSSHPNLSFSKSNLPEMSQSSSLTTINYAETSTDVNGMPKDFSTNDNSMLHSPKSHGESSIFHKIHSVCGEHNHTSFPFSDPHSSANSCAKVYCDNSVERVENKEDIDSPLSSEDDVDVGI